MSGTKLDLQKMNPSPSALQAPMQHSSAIASLPMSRPIPNTQYRHANRDYDCLEYLICPMQSAPSWRCRRRPLSLDESIRIG